MGPLFKKFVSDYFPDPYKEYSDDLWEFRSKLIHASSTGRFLITDHNSKSHFKTPATTSVPMSASGRIVQPGRLPDGVILNAEDFYAGLLSAAQSYFSEVRQSANLQTILRERIKGGAIAIREIES